MNGILIRGSVQFPCFYSDYPTNLARSHWVSSCHHSSWASGGTWWWAWSGWSSPRCTSSAPPCVWGPGCWPCLDLKGRWHGLVQEDGACSPTASTYSPLRGSLFLILTASSASPPSHLLSETSTNTSIDTDTLIVSFIDTVCSSTLRQQYKDKYYIWQAFPQPEEEEKW